MLMGDCLALLQDGNFLAQWFWFRVPGGADRLGGPEPAWCFLLLGYSLDAKLTRYRIIDVSLT